MNSARQRAYLDAMGIEVWSLRQTPPSLETTTAHTREDEATNDGAIDDRTIKDGIIDGGPTLKLGSGSGGILLVCAADVDSASRLANDISRAMTSVPVWAWPAEESTAVSLTAAVDDKLFTTVAIFGTDLAGQFVEGGLPTNMNSANLVILPSMQELQTQADARKSLWTTICRSGMVSKS